MQKKQTNLQVRLHAHACVEFSSEDFSLLTDPWLVGRAFLGSWVLYPEPQVIPEDLNPKALLITHEHSDHFHEETLSRMSSDTPIYVPDFPNQRLQNRLKAMGHTQVVPMRFGQTYEIFSGWKITSYEPLSLWNDAIFLIEIHGKKFLNINDAGINHRILKEIGEIDTLLIQFSAGASGYPFNWKNLSWEQKLEINQRSSFGKLRMIRKAAELYQAKYVVPIASFFALGDPAHRSYAENMHMNTPQAVKSFLNQNYTAEGVDLLPGDKWCFETNQIERSTSSEVLKKEAVLDYLNKNCSDSLPPSQFGRPFQIEEIKNALLKLNETPEIIFSENVGVHLKVISDLKDQVELEVFFEIVDGALRLVDAISQKAQIFITIPASRFYPILNKDASWDEVFIGYWCEFDRSPDQYHAGFWRLLQAPYYLKQKINPDTSPVIDQMSVADLLEKHGVSAERILGRYGLYCLGCHRSTQETLSQAAQSHGLLPQDRDRLLKELNQLQHLEISKS